MFKRCLQRTALKIELTSADAENILIALNGKGPGPLPELGRIEHMRVTFPGTDDTVESAFVLVAFSVLAVACRNTQVCGMLIVNAPALSQEQKFWSLLAVCNGHPGKHVAIHETNYLMLLQIAVLTFHQDIALPPFAALRHLILNAIDPADPPYATLKNGIPLETLSLVVCGDSTDWSHVNMNLSSLHALKHVRLENFAPGKLHVPDGCLLHIVWDEASAISSEFRRWARVRRLWQAQPNRLGSLQICCLEGEPNIASLKSILTGDQELVYISLCIPKLSNENQPFSVDPGSCQMLAFAKRVRLCSKKICSISVTNMQPMWKKLSIDAARVNLEVEDTAALVRSLDNFWIKGVTSHGFSSMSMMHELHQSGRKCSVNRQTGDGAEGTPQGFAFGTLLDCTAQGKFEELMNCGCSSCLACLSQAGKLSRDSPRPKDR